jgi:hypothetical protein
MRKVLLIPAVAMVVVGLAAPVPATQTDEPDVSEIKEEIKTPITAGGVAGGIAAPESLGPSGFAAPPRGGANVQVSQDQDPAAVFRSGASELTIAVAGNGRRAVVGWNDGEGFGFAPFDPSQPPLGLSGFGFTTDGGETWTDGGAPPLGSTIAFGPGTEGQSATGNYVTRGDPWLDAERRANPTFFYTNLAVWEDDAVGPPAGVSLHRGSFDGGVFSWEDSVLIQSPNYPNDFLDKEALAVQRRGGRTAVYISVTNFEEVCDIPFFGFGTIEVYGSLDGGDTWSRTVVQPDESFITDPSDPDCGLDGVVNQGSMPAVGPGGEVYVTWERGWFAPLAGGSALPRATIAFASSTDDGATFTAPVEVASVCSLAANPPAAYNRTSTNDFPRIAVAQSGPHKGRVYITYQDCSAASGAAPFGADTDVYVTFSDDGGSSWSPATPVHPVADGKAQFWPAISVGRAGRVDVTYYEMVDVNVTPDPTDIECSVRIGGPLEDPELRESTLTTFSDVGLVQSGDGGQTWGPPTVVTEVSTNWCAATPINSIIPNFGDYNTSVSRGSVFVTWADGRNGGALDLVPTAFFDRR